MPRPFVTGEQALLEGESYGTHLQVFVEDPDGAFVDLTALGGRNWLVGLEFRSEQDQPVSTINVELWREDVTGSLAPLMGGSTYNRDALDQYARLLDVGREFYVRNAITAAATAPTGGQWWELCRGIVRTIPHGDRRSRIVLQGQDLGARLLKARSKEELTFGVDGQSLEAGLQLVLDRWLPGVSLYTPSATVRTIPRLVVAKDRPVFDVLREAALPHDVRYLWDAGTSSFRLTLYLPDRDKTDEDLTLGPSLYDNVEHFEISDRYIRNDFSITFTNASTGKRETVTRQNQDSIDAYDAAWMGFEEGSNSTIDNTAEAEDFLEAADSDVSFPLAEQEVRLRYYPHILLNDLILFEANGVQYDSDQKFAVVGVRHRLYPTERRTWVRTRPGKPVGAVKEWFRRSLNPPEPVGSEASVIDVEHIATASGLRTYRVHMGSIVGETHVHWKLFTGDLPDNYLAQVMAEENLHSILDEDGDTFQAPEAPEGKALRGYVFPRVYNQSTEKYEVSGGGIEFKHDGTPAPIKVTVTATENAAGTSVDLDVTPNDPRGVVSGARIWVTQDGVESGPTSLTLTGGVFEGTVALLPKPHVTAVRGELTRSDGGPAVPFVFPPLDSDKVADVILAPVSENDAGTATVNPQVDSDGVAGAGNGRYSLNGGGAWSTFTIDANLRGVFSVTQTTSEQDVLIQAKNANGDWGRSKQVKIPAYLGAVERFHRFAASMFVENAGSWANNGEFINNSGAGDSFFNKGVRFPKGIQLTKLRLHGYKAGTGVGSGVDGVDVFLGRIPDAGGVFSNLASCVLPSASTGWLTEEDTLSETVGDDAYFFAGHVGAATPGNAKMKWIEVGYLGSWR